jgi:hypothetical protein
MPALACAVLSIVFFYMLGEVPEAGRLTVLCIGTGFAFMGIIFSLLELHTRSDERRLELMAKAERDGLDEGQLTAEDITRIYDSEDSRYDYRALIKHPN